MAGVEDTMIAYSFFESLSDFITDNVNTIKKEIKSNDLIICGNLFANSILLSKIGKNLKNINLHIPKEYPLDF